MFMHVRIHAYTHIARASRQRHVQSTGIFQEADTPSEGTLTIVTNASAAAAVIPLVGVVTPVVATGSLFSGAHTRDDNNVLFSPLESVYRVHLHGR
jgi:hypothetical protein